MAITYDTPDPELAAIADYVLETPIAGELAFEMAHLALFDFLGCALKALDEPGCTTADAGSSVSGAVAHIDRFGNLLTSIPRELLEPFAERVRVEIADAGLVISGLSRTYGDVESGCPAALVSSDGHLEIAVRDGSASTRYGIEIGTPVRVSGCDQAS